MSSEPDLFVIEHEGDLVIEVVLGNRERFSVWFNRDRAAGYFLLSNDVMKHGLTVRPCGIIPKDKVDLIAAWMLENWGEP